MMPCSRILLLTTISILLLSPLSGEKVLSEQAPTPNNQPAPPNLPTEPKAPLQSPAPAKPEPPKLSTEPKPQSQSTPPVQPEGPAERDTKEKEKEKEVHKKALGSLILSVKLALLADTRLFRYEIEVGEDERTITLGGRVSTDDDKAIATEIARSVPTVKTVVNKLDVDKNLLLALVKKQDDIITGLVKERFAKSATLKAANFEVKTEEGVVSISGAVRFQVIALEAAEAARQVPGVRAVKTDKVRLEVEG